MCDLIAIQANYSMGDSVHTGVTMIAYCTDVAAYRLTAALTVDSGIRVYATPSPATSGQEVALTVCPCEV